MVNNNAILVSYHETYFNKVLFIMREPGGGKTDSDSTKGNKEWFLDVCKGGKNNLQTRYFNRFSEMLKFVNCENLSNSAYTNIKLNSGGTSVSKDYWKITKEEKKGVVDKLIDNIKPEIIFTCWDIFNSVCTYADIKKDGLKYNPNRIKRACEYRGVQVYEILHPCRSPKIILEGTDSSKNNKE